MRYHEEKRVQLLLQQQNMEQQISVGVSWSSPSSDSQSLSFLEIQSEQEKQFGVRDGVGVANRTTTTKKFNVVRMDQIYMYIHVHNYVYMYIHFLHQLYGILL